MAEYGEWTRKGATLSDKTAQKEYGISQEFILKGIREEKLEFKEGNIYGNPYFKLLRRELENYISSELGQTYLMEHKNKKELQELRKIIKTLEKRVAELKLKEAALKGEMSGEISLSE
ncbi:hypothetical protein [Methanoplanus limicola]|uniref:Uncharacterized protein n=1 Tax=Methanoplanus limicola DSM 2279 TaxID=937775 RepID=H1Z3A7_9EURY|nr:hypothetical protein [Methanoplanus limicola]EHQ36522.1 hypothetical protein Metlim_2475 [Methanoplanus limicola DSM 2279]